MPQNSTSFTISFIGTSDRVTVVKGGCWKYFSGNRIYTMQTCSTEMSSSGLLFSFRSHLKHFIGSSEYPEAAIGIIIVLANSSS